MAVCSLLSASQVTALLGAPAAQPGKETVYDTNYKTCSWATGSAAGNANSLRLGVVLKANASSSGFAAPTSAGTPSPISGVGDSATFASAAGGAGAFGESILVANKGLACLSIDVSYGGSISHPASTSATIADDARAIFPTAGRGGHRLRLAVFSATEVEPEGRVLVAE